MSGICVIGSVNTDIVFKTDIVPREGETVQGESYFITNGGKGANVAVASSRLGEHVLLVANVGDDMFSKNALENLKNENVDVSTVSVLKGEQGGVANITLSNGNNRIVVIPGANNKLTAKYFKKFIGQIKKCSIVGGQFEVPIETLYLASKFCYDNNIKFVLNPSPVKEFPKEMVEFSTYIIVNEVEVREFENSAEEKEEDILKRFPNKLILTKGGDGVFFFDGNKVVNIPAIKVQVKDTTGAGDTFLGAFMVGINRGFNLQDAIIFANICAGLKTTKIGAQTGMPKLNEVKKYIKVNKVNIKI